MKWLHQTGGYASGGNQPFEHYGARSWKYFINVLLFYANWQGNSGLTLFYYTP
jgi:hypothetical protein